VELGPLLGWDLACPSDSGDSLSPEDLALLHRRRLSRHSWGYRGCLGQWHRFFKRRGGPLEAAGCVRQDQHNISRELHLRRIERLIESDVYDLRASFHGIAKLALSDASRDRVPERPRIQQAGELR